MIYQIILFVVLFVITGIVHGPLKAHDTQKKWLKTAHFWLEHAVVIQGIIVINELLKLIK